MRRLAAVLACRAGSSRLYCKPLQNLAPGISILDNIVETLRRESSIGAIVLAISEGAENECFRQYAIERRLPYVFGDQTDVLDRLIRGGRLSGSTDVFRVTTESPFVWHDVIDEVWRSHLENANAITVTDNLPIGSHFEIYTAASLEASHARGEGRHRSELCSLYARENPDQFQIQSYWPCNEMRRPDIRFTVDYPEDLIVCRDTFNAVGLKHGCAELRGLITAFDARPHLSSLISELPRGKLFWEGVPVLELQPK